MRYLLLWAFGGATLIAIIISLSAVFILKKYEASKVEKKVVRLVIKLPQGRYQGFIEVREDGWREFLEPMPERSGDSVHIWGCEIRSSGPVYKQVSDNPNYNK
jgi:hypothetical protein